MKIEIGDLADIQENGKNLLNLTRLTIDKIEELLYINEGEQALYALVYAIAISMQFSQGTLCPAAITKSFMGTTDDNSTIKH